jgi:hypothetical protein
MMGHSYPHALVCHQSAGSQQMFQGCLSELTTLNESQIFKINSWDKGNVDFNLQPRSTDSLTTPQWDIS